MNNSYRVVVRKFEINGKWIRLNKILDGKTYNYRTKRYVNPVKSKGDSICMRAILGQIKGVSIKGAVEIHYQFFAPDRWDADGVISAFWKCFLDALQKCKVIEGDSYKVVGYPIIDSYEIDEHDPRVVTTIIVKGDTK